MCVADDDDDDVVVVVVVVVLMFYRISHFSNLILKCFTNVKSWILMNALTDCTTMRCG